jgi:hypothetical protein
MFYDMSQVVMVSLEDLVPENHIYRNFKKLWDFEFIEEQLKSIETDRNFNFRKIKRRTAKTRNHLKNHKK